MIATGLSSYFYPQKLDNFTKISQNFVLVKSDQYSDQVTSEPPLGLVDTVSDYFSCEIAFLNPVQKTLLCMSVSTEPGKQLSDTISC